MANCQKSQKRSLFEVRLLRDSGAPDLLRACGQEKRSEGLREGREGPKKDVASKV